MDYPLGQCGRHGFALAHCLLFLDAKAQSLRRVAVGMRWEEEEEEGATGRRCNRSGIDEKVEASRSLSLESRVSCGFRRRNCHVMLLHEIIYSGCLLD